MVELYGNANIGRGIAMDWDIVHPAHAPRRRHRVQAVVANTSGSWQFDPRQRLRLTLQGSEVTRDPRCTCSR